MPLQKPKRNFDRLIAIINLAVEIGLSEEKWFIDEIEILSFRFDSLRYQKLIERCLGVKNFPSLINQTFRNPLTKEEIELLKGDYQFGEILRTGIEVGLTERSLVLHTLVSGASGFGKTIFMNALSEPVQNEGKIVEWKIDPKTGMYDFRHQIKKYPDMVLLTLDVLKCNPFGMITNVPRQAIKVRSTEVLSDCFGVYDASQGVIAEHVEKIFEREEKPCFKDVADSILSEKLPKFGGRRQGYLDTLEVRIRTIMMSAINKIFDCREDYFNSLYDKSVIFEVGGSETAQKVLVPFIIMKLSLFKTYNG